jgi:hypothetical protein
MKEQNKNTLGGNRRGCLGWGLLVIGGLVLLIVPLEQPDLVIAAIRDIVEQVRGK